MCRADSRAGGRSGEARASSPSTQNPGHNTQILGYHAVSPGVWAAVLEGIFGNASAEKVLLYLEQYEEGYATAIARTFDGLSLNMAQRQLDRFERAGALVSSLKGRTRLYTWNPRYPFRSELRALLRKALTSLPAFERRRHFVERRRPRRAGKPL